MWQRLALRHGKEFVKHVAPAVIKPARTLWNEVIGFIFLCLAVPFGGKAVRLYLDYSAAPPEVRGSAVIRLALAVFCTVLMAWFGISSFLRARRISRS